MLLFLPWNYLFYKKVIAVCNQDLFYSSKSVRIHNWKKCQILIPEIFGGESYNIFRLQNTRMFISCKFFYTVFAPWILPQSNYSKQMQISFKRFFPKLKKAKADHSAAVPVCPWRIHGRQYWALVLILWCITNGTSWILLCGSFVVYAWPKNI